MHSAWLRSTFLRVLKYLQIKEVDLIFGGNQFWKKSELFLTPFCISILKVLSSKFLRHSLDFNAFCMIKENFSQSFEISTNWRGGSNFWGEPILQKVLIIWSSLLYFNFKNFIDPNSSSFIRFQCILHNSGALSSESYNFYKLKGGI